MLALLSFGQASCSWATSLHVRTNPKGTLVNHPLPLSTHWSPIHDLKCPSVHVSAQPNNERRHVAGNIQFACQDKLKESTRFPIIPLDTLASNHSLPPFATNPSRRAHQTTVPVLRNSRPSCFASTVLLQSSHFSTPNWPPLFSGSG
jgi:hypothetical protein